MKRRNLILLILLCFPALFNIRLLAQTNKEQTDKNIPYLQKQGTATQLVVDGKPFLMLAGELGNSSTSNLDYMRPIWTKLAKMHLNTVLAPVYWELIEPEEGKFDFSLVDTMIRDASKNKLRLVFLWFGSWKNSMSCYAPLWIKVNQERFPRSRDRFGKGMEILSAFNEENLDADKKAFVSLMKHINLIDKSHVVIMIQVENEIGMLNEARDHCEASDKLYSATVPNELINYMQKHKESLVPEFFESWKNNGLKVSGTWGDVFGKSLTSDEIFMAWYYARYTNKIAEEGKNILPLPMYVNAALNRPNVKPGDYPSAGPLPHLMDVWIAGAPSIDFLSPDIYFDNVKDWIVKYHYSGNPIFLPEIRSGEQNAAQVFYIIGQNEAMGFSPFSIETTDNPEKEPLTKSYDILNQLTPMILKYQGKGFMAGVLLDKDYQKEDVKLGNYILHVAHDYTLGWSPKAKEPGPWPASGCIIISTGNDEYYIGGTGIVITFDANSPGDPLVGFARIDEGKFINGKWIPGRRMNGDQDHQGRHMRIPVGDWGIQKIQLYRYR